MRNFTICFTNCFTICSESCQSVAVLVLTMRQQVREVHSFSQSPAAGCKHQQHNSSLLLSQCCHCFKSDCKHTPLSYSVHHCQCSKLSHRKCKKFNTHFLTSSFLTILSELSKLIGSLFKLGHITNYVHCHFSSSN